MDRTNKQDNMTRQTRPFPHRHLLGATALEADDIGCILRRARHFDDDIAAGRAVPQTLAGKPVLGLFFEDSTRTRMSFEHAARLLGGAWYNLDIGRSAVKKGEGLMDTVHTMESMLAPAAMIIRHSEYAAPDYIAARVKCAVVNAGDSWREHPTQALLDAYTIEKHKGRVAGLRVAICGDIAHSRVAASNMAVLRALGAHINIIAPPVLMPEKLPADGITAYETMEEGLKDCDIVMMLRIQKERMQSGLIESDEAFFRQYGLTFDRLAHARPDALVMHPGPMNRGVEIAADIADDPKRSVILDQVRNGVYVRMAVLDLLAGGTK